MSNQDKRSDKMIVRGEDLDQLLTLAGEVIISSSNQSVIAGELQEMLEQKRSVEMDIVKTTKDLATTTSVLSSDLHHLVQSIRTVDLKDLGLRARRLVRNISKKTGKPINFQIEGEETTIDKAIVEKLLDPISHQLRNAIDHGIEDVQSRKKRNKPDEGQVTMRIYNTEQDTFIEISDDGEGLDVENVRKKGIEKGVITASDLLNDETILKVLCAPGVSTAAQVSEVSGRGVGMDVVKNHLDEIGGSINFKTKPGEGTTFTFQIPLLSAVNIVDALVVRSNESIYAFPIANVVSSISLNKDAIESTFNKGDVVKYLNQLLPLFELSEVLNRHKNGRIQLTKDIVPILIIEHKQNKIALVVSEFLAPQKLVIIPFDETLSVTGLIGTTILEGRSLGFIIDVPSLIELAVDKDFVTGKRVLTKNDDFMDPMGDVVSDEASVPPPRIDVKKIEQQPDQQAKQSAELVPDTNDEDFDEMFAGEFISEVEKLYLELSESVYSLESDLGNSDLINATFRLFHTVKGNLIMMGLQKGGETVHCVESVLDQVRTRNVEVSPEILDIINEGVSYIEELVQQSKAGQWKDVLSKDISEQCAAILPEETFEHDEVDDVASEDIKLSNEAAYRAVIHRKQQMNFYRIYVEFNSGVQPSFLVACLIYKRICEIGDVLGTSPYLNDIEKGMMHGKLKMLFASDQEYEFLNQRLSEFLSEHYGASLVKLTSVA